VKGTIEEGELPRDAARLNFLKRAVIDVRARWRTWERWITWHFFTWRSTGLPDHWEHATADDSGHTFAFFWHPVGVTLDDEWHPIFKEAFQFVCSHLVAR